MRGISKRTLGRNQYLQTQICLNKYSYYKVTSKNFTYTNTEPKRPIPAPSRHRDKKEKDVISILYQTNIPSKVKINTFSCLNEKAKSKAITMTLVPSLSGRKIKLDFEA